jgi:sugar phosphate permease
MHGKLKIVFAIWLLQVVNYIDRVVMGFAGPSMMQSLGIEPKTFGVILSSFAFGYFLTQIPGGFLADRWGSRAVLVIGPLFWALFTGLTGLVASVAALTFVRLCFGVAEGLSNAATYKLVGDNFEDPKDRGQAVAVWVTAFAAAPAFTGPFVGILLASFAWQSVFLMLAVPALIVAAVNYTCLPATGAALRTTDSKNHFPPDNAMSFRDLFRQPSLWLIGSAFGLWSVAYWGLLGWMPSYLALERHIDIRASGMLGGVPYIFGLLGIVLSGWLGSGPFLRHRPQLLAGMYLGAGASLYFAYISATVTLSLVGLSVAAFFIYGALGTYGAVVLDAAPEGARAAYSGITSTIGQIGSVLAPVIIGYLVSETGVFAAGFGFMIAALVVAAACVIALPLLSAERSPSVVVPAAGPKA